jgi:potassium-dependent mechanosensitive channel
VAFGSDTERITEILETVARRHPLVLNDPSACAMLESFGDNSLNFVLRCFLPNLDNRGTVIHDLHVGIAREFHDAGIEFALPQQDIHVRSIDVPLSMLQPGPGTGGGRLPWPAAEPGRTAKVA